jgi:lysophospholipase L1-like esterase
MAELVTARRWPMIGFSVRAGVLALALLLALGLTEVVLRVSGYWPRISLEWYLTSATRVPSREVIMIHPKFLKKRHYSVGEDHEVVVALGDSFTAGFPVGAADGYPSLLQDMLGEVGRDTTVINMGLGNSGPDQQLRLLKDYVLTYVMPDVVVWAFYANDVRDNVRQPAYEVVDGRLVPLDGAKHWLYERQRLYSSLPLPGSFKESSALVRLLLHWWETALAVPVDQATEARAEEKIRLGVAEMERLAQQHGFEVHYALIAPQALYLRRGDAKRWQQYHGIRQYEILREILAERQFIDVLFSDALASGLPPQFGVFASPERDRNSLGDRHFNETGYRRLAQLVLEALAAEREPK